MWYNPICNKVHHMQTLAKHRKQITNWSKLWSKTHMNSQHLISVLISEMNINNHFVLKFSWPINMSITSICDNQKYAIPSIVPLNILNLRIHTLCLTRSEKYHNKRGKGKGIELKLSTLKKKTAYVLWIWYKKGFKRQVIKVFLFC